MLASPELLREAARPQSLAEMLVRCATQVPLYRQIDNDRDSRSASLTSIRTDLRSWPFITKRDIRQGFPANFLGADQHVDQLVEEEIIELEHTSGTSEERTPLLLPFGWWAEQESRALHLNASVAQVLRENPDARRVTINSPVCSGDIRYHGVPSRHDRVVGNSLFVSLSRYPFLWSERDFERMATEVMEWRPEFLDIDPAYGVVFALYCERNGLKFPSLRFIICSYEFVSILHRSILRRAFDVPVFDLYGSTETGHLLMEDDEGQMRPSIETAFLEMHNVDNHGIGELVVTTLTNPFMPLIRYRIGDLVQRVENPYGTRYILHGRAADAFRTTTGQRVTTRQVDLCFAEITGIAHYQLIQRGDSVWSLKFVADGTLPDEDRLTALQERVSHLLQTIVPVSVEPTDILVPESSGKFRLGYPIFAA